MFKKVLKIAGWTLVSLLGIILLAIGYIKLFLPRISAPDIKIEATNARLERGKYLATYVSGCITCHSKRDETRYGAPVVPGTLGQGGEVFNLEVGRLVSSNITPYALRDWTDGEIYRAITCGVSKNGRPLFPLMPYQNFAQMDREDVYSIIAYIRTLSPIAVKQPDRELKFPMSVIVHTIPALPKENKLPPATDRFATGKYLATISNCADCHSPMDKGKFIEGLAFSGGNPFPVSVGKLVHSANITPDRQTGIGDWGMDVFTHRFKAALDSGFAHPVSGSEDQTIMPWNQFAHMEQTDLEAIYTYLRTVPPVNKKVVKYTDMKP